MTRRPGRRKRARGVASAADAVPREPRRLSDRQRAAFLACLAFVVYNANMRGVSAGDCRPARFLPFSLLAHGTLSLDPFLEAAKDGVPGAFWIVGSVRGPNVSVYPVVTPLVVAPLYVPATVALHLAGWPDPLLRKGAEVMEKLAASTLAAVSAGLLYLLLRRRLDPGRAMLLASAFAFGTNLWMTGSQALWQHGTGAFFVIVALLCLTGEPTTRTTLLLGATCALVAVNRPPDAILAAALGGAGLLRAPKKAPALAAAAVVTAVPFLLYNWLNFRHLFGGYGVIVTGSFFFRSTVPAGLAGLLVSPGKGLLFYSPFLLFLAGLSRARFREGEDRRLAYFLAAGVLAQLVFYSQLDWRAGFSYGPRFLVDMLPILAWLMVPVVASLRARGLAAFSLAAAVSTGPQVVGAFWYPTGGSDSFMYSNGPDLPSDNVWALSMSPVLLELRAGRAEMTFVGYLRELPAQLPAAEPAR